MKGSKRVKAILALVTGLAPLSLPGRAIAEQPDGRTSEPANVRYRMPVLMMVTWAEWPDAPQQQDVMARFVRANGFNCVEVEVDKLDMCRRNGLYARLGSGDINAMLKDAVRLKDDKSVFAYFISDRRRHSAFPVFAQIARAYAKVDPNHPTMFINRANWNEYQDFVKQVQPMLLDFYHYHWDPRRHPERRYIYLASFRELGLKHGIPVMRCVSASVPAPQLRQTIYTSLAYGVQGFHFWPPWMFGFRAKDGKPILKDGRIVPRFNLPALVEVAKEIKSLGPVLIKLRSTAVYHTKPVHPEAPGAAPVPKDCWVQPSGEQVLVGMFKDAAGKEAKEYLMVVNRDACRKRQATLSMEPTVRAAERMDKLTGKWAALEIHKNRGRVLTTLELTPGNGELLRVLRKRKK